MDRAVVQRIASEYDRRHGDADAKVFSQEFRCPIMCRGYLCRCEFLKIVKWKAVRQTPNAANNDPELVEIVTRRAFAEEDPRLAAWLLRYLKGVSTRMASAILTVFDPSRYTVMDVRAWKTLEKIGLEKLRLPPAKGTLEDHLDSCETYAAYLKTCRGLAQECGVSLRTLDKCLWMLNGNAPERCCRSNVQPV